MTIFLKGEEKEEGSVEMKIIYFFEALVKERKKEGKKYIRI
jgi:hypothetical protein